MSSNPKMEMGRAIIAAAYIAVGIILISHPGVTGIIICRTAGGLALLLGGFRVFTALRARGADWFFHLDLICCWPSGSLRWRSRRWFCQSCRWYWACIW